MELVPLWILTIEIDSQVQDSESAAVPGDGLHMKRWVCPQQHRMNVEWSLCGGQGRRWELSGPTTRESPVCEDSGEKG